MNAYNSNYLAHYGILGMKWGVRRYQNKDGTYTEAGKERRRSDSDSTQKSRNKTERLNEKARQAEARRAIRTAKEAERQAAQQSRIQEAQARRAEQQVRDAERQAEQQARREEQQMRQNARQAAQQERLRAIQIRRDELDLKRKEAEARRAERLADQKVSGIPSEQVAVGKKYAVGIMGDIGKKVLTTAITGAALYAVSQAVAHKLDGGLSGQAKNPEYWQGLGAAIFNGGPKKK